MLTHLDLFSGIGGFALAAQRCGFTTVAFCEIEPYAQEILKERFGAVMANSERGRCEPNGEFKSVDGMGTAGKNNTMQTSQSNTFIHANIFTLNGADYRGVTLLTGGFPCQPFSCAGKRRGKEDERALWPEMFRVIKESRPHWIVGENVAGIITMELDSVLSDLESEGYATRTFVIPACSVDAKHRRDRVWIVAHSGSVNSRTRNSSRGQGIKITDSSETLAHQSIEGLERTTGEGVQRGIGGLAGGSAASDANGQRGCLWKVGFQNAGDVGESSRCEERSRLIEPRLGKLVDGLPQGMDGYCQWTEENLEETPRVAIGIKNRVQRLKALGNAIVPQVAEEIIRCISQIEIGLTENGDKKV